jgi:hypothetical protein
VGGATTSNKYLRKQFPPFWRRYPGDPVGDATGQPGMSWQDEVAAPSFSPGRMVPAFRRPAAALALTSG